MIPHFGGRTLQRKVKLGGVKNSKEPEPRASKRPLSRHLIIAHSHMQLPLEERGHGLRFDIEGTGS
jgi:hypothetical protein